MVNGSDPDEFHPELIKLANEFPIEKYGEEKTFKFLGEARRPEKKLVGANMWVDVVIVDRKYACEKFGHACTISVPQEELEKPAINAVKKSEE